ncbi:hypothetical protein B0H17DRAFT_1219769 [Mycena rosella]|uniref:Uncharacterized protein n=1 Tax=Mycena rosella TaxID=1033263 RepID=A0AAD7BFH4_MYCRO|nr:hypothetical protein B0H17DRAFT_1219769 [Mycena rosella]
MALEIFPFHHSDDFGYEIVERRASPRARCSLYEQVLEAQARQERSFLDLPVDLIISILAIAASRSTGITLALTSSWIADVTLTARLAHISIRTVRALESFHHHVCSSLRAAGAVQTLWILTNAGSHRERTLIPDVLRACVNLRAVACQVSALEDLSSAEDPFPQSLGPFRLTLMENMRHPYAGSPGSNWGRILSDHHGTSVLHNLTHLHLAQYHELDTHFPAAHLPRLTHLAMGKFQTWIGGPYFPALVRRVSDFAEELDQLSLQLAMAVLVFWPHKNVTRKSTQRGQSPQPWPVHELAQAARDCGSGSNIMVYCASYADKESEFWEQSVGAGEDIWTLAQKQMSEANQTD